MRTQHEKVGDIVEEANYVAKGRRIEALFRLLARIVYELKRINEREDQRAQDAMDERCESLSQRKHRLQI